MKLPRAIQTLTSPNLIKKSFCLTCCSISLGVVLLSNGIAPKSWAGEAVSGEVQLAALLETNDIPSPSRFSNPSQIEYGTQIRGVLNASSHRFQGRRFNLYQFNGEAGQLIRINLVGGLASAQPTDRLQTNTRLSDPVLILLDSKGKMIAQQPEQSGLANALIRLKLPATDTYKILVTSATMGTGGSYSLTLQQLRDDGSNSVIEPNSLSRNQQIAEQFIDLLFAGKYEDALSYLDPQLRSEFSPEIVAERVELFERTRGAFVERLNSKEDQNIVLVEVKFQKMTQTIIVIFDDESMITGIDYFRIVDDYRS